MLVHAREFVAPHGRPIDKADFDRLWKDPEVKSWMKEMRKAALLPLPRKAI